MFVLCLGHREYYATSSLSVSVIEDVETPLERNGFNRRVSVRCQSAGRSSLDLYCRDGRIGGKWAGKRIEEGGRAMLTQFLSK